MLIAAEDRGGKIGRIRLSPIGNASGEVLATTVQTMVAVDSTVRTDGWSGYSSLQELGYTHVPIHNDDVKNSDAIQLVHLVASLLKRWLIGTHHGAISPKNLPYYLDEFAFRFNRRTSRSRGKLFYRLVQQALAIDPVPTQLLSH